MRDTLVLAWQRFKIIAAIVADGQSQIIGLLFYFTILVPFAIVARLSPDPTKNHAPRWIKREVSPNSLHNARRQG